MPIDASIFGNVGRGVKSMAEYDAEYAQAENAKQAGQLNALNLLMGQRKIAAEDRGLADQEALRKVVGGFGADDTANEQALVRAGRLDEAMKLRKSVVDAAKVKADTAHQSVQTSKLTDEQERARKDDAFRHILSFKDPDAAMRSLSEAKNIPEDMRAALMGGLQKAAGNPTAYEAWQSDTMIGMLSPKERLELVRNSIKDKIDAANKDILVKPDGTTEANKPLWAAKNEVPLAGIERQRQDNAAARAVQMRGQNMTDARSRETNSATMTKPFEVTGPDGLPLLVRQDKQGNITPVEGFGPKTGASKPLNDTQAKALLFGTRMQESDKVLNELAKSGAELPSLTKRTAESVPLIGGALGMAANAYASPQQQQIEQAQRDFINAVLRRESGAAIAESEFANARKQYFPEVGDSKEAKAQKARNRQLATAGLLAEVPEGRRQSITPKAAQPAADESPKPAGSPTVSNW